MNHNASSLVRFICPNGCEYNRGGDIVYMAPVKAGSIDGSQGYLQCFKCGHSMIRDKRRERYVNAGYLSGRQASTKLYNRHAKKYGMSIQALVKLIESHKLNATKVRGTWYIAPNEIKRYNDKATTDAVHGRSEASD